MKKLYKFLLNTLPRPLLIRASYVFRVFTPVFFAGKKVFCPVCEHSFGKFLSYGSRVKHRENVLCPRCLSLERHRLIWLYLREETDFFKKPYKMLHVAPEQCFYGRFRRQENLDYTTADLNSPLADLKFDLHDIPLPDDSYEVIFCNHVLEHVEDDAQCLRELYRIMKPGGWGIMQVPIDYSRAETYEDDSITAPHEREEHFWQKDHVRLFGRDYPKKLREAGFKVEENHLAERKTTVDKNPYRLQKRELLYVVRK